MKGTSERILYVIILLILLFLLIVLYLVVGTNLIKRIIAGVP
ncbi:MAG: hypothetical protein QMD12_03120 [Candidatus Aenigmarchaeota archaeon]|nr:hypothetical protein [Candidatus Aenigmarchaeota archaeon]